MFPGRIRVEPGWHRPTRVSSPVPQTLRVSGTLLSVDGFGTSLAHVQAVERRIERVPEQVVGAEFAEVAQVVPCHG